MKNRLTLPPVVMVPAIAFLIAGGAWWLFESTVPVGDFEVVVAQLDSTNEELASTRETLDDVVAQLDSTKEELASTQEALSAEQSRLQQADPVPLAAGSRPAALLLGYFAGVDPEIVDQNRYDSWPGVVKLDTAVQAVNDPELTELYWQHMGEGGFSPGSEALVVRLIELTIEPILRGQ